MGRVVPHTWQYLTVETPLGFSALVRRIEAEGERDDTLIAVQIGDLGFFPSEKVQDYTKAEIARFFARCQDCREPVALPYYAVAEIGWWTDGSIRLRRWLQERRFGPHDPDPMTERQHRALRRLQEIIGLPDPDEDH